MITGLSYVSGASIKFEKSHSKYSNSQVLRSWYPNPTPPRRISKLNPVPTGLCIITSCSKVSPGIISIGRSSCWGCCWCSCWGRVYIQPSQATQVTQEVNAGPYHRTRLHRGGQWGQVGGSWNLNEETKDKNLNARYRSYRIVVINCCRGRFDPQTSPWRRR